MEMATGQSQNNSHLRNVGMFPWEQKTPGFAEPTASSIYRSAHLRSSSTQRGEKKTYVTGEYVPDYNSTLLTSQSCGGGKGKSQFYDLSRFPSDGSMDQTRPSTTTPTRHLSSDKSASGKRIGDFGITDTPHSYIPRPVHSAYYPRSQMFSQTESKECSSHTPQLRGGDSMRDIMMAGDKQNWNRQHSAWNARVPGRYGSQTGTIDLSFGYQRPQTSIYPKTETGMHQQFRPCTVGDNRRHGVASSGSHTGRFPTGDGRRFGVQQMNYLPAAEMNYSQNANEIFRGALGDVAELFSLVRCPIQAQFLLNGKTPPAKALVNANLPFQEPTSGLETKPTWLHSLWERVKTSVWNSNTDESCRDFESREMSHDEDRDSSDVHENEFQFSESHIHEHLNDPRFVWQEMFAICCRVYKKFIFTPQQVGKLIEEACQCVDTRIVGDTDSVITSLNVLWKSGWHSVTNLTSELQINQIDNSAPKQSSWKSAYRFFFSSNLVSVSPTCELLPHHSLVYWPPLEEAIADFLCVSTQGTNKELEEQNLSDLHVKLGGEALQLSKSRLILDEDVRLWLSKRLSEFPNALRDELWWKAAERRLAVETSSVQRVVRKLDHGIVVKGFKIRKRRPLSADGMASASSNEEALSQSSDPPSSSSASSDRLDDNVLLEHVAEKNMQDKLNLYRNT